MAAGDLAAEIPPTTITYEAQIPFTRLRVYRHRFLAAGRATCQKCGGRLNFNIEESENYPLNETVVAVRCVRCPQAGQFPFRQPADSPWSRGEVLSDAVASEVMMEKRYEVFISSTFADLEEERAKVAQALLHDEFFPTGMEMFPASDDSQWKVIERAIERCDYYVVIVAGRYGSRAKDDVSYTEKEYDLAVSLGIPVLGFVHRNPDAIPQGKTDKSDKARKRLEDSRNKVRKDRICSDWENAEELARKVVAAVSKAIHTNPRPGWVRGTVGGGAEETASPTSPPESTEEQAHKAWTVAALARLRVAAAAGGAGAVQVAPGEKLHAAWALARGFVDPIETSRGDAVILPAAERWANPATPEGKVRAARRAILTECAMKPGAFCGWQRSSHGQEYLDAAQELDSEGLVQAKLSADREDVMVRITAAGAALVRRGAF
jgi:hypothetical protein